MSGDSVAGSASGLAGRRGQRRLLGQVQYSAGQPGRQTGCSGDELVGQGQDYFRPAGADRLDDLPGARSASIDSSGRLAPSANQVNSFPACR